MRENIYYLRIGNKKDKNKIELVNLFGIRFAAWNVSLMGRLSFLFQI